MLRRLLFSLLEQRHRLDLQCNVRITSHGAHQLFALYPYGRTIKQHTLPYRKQMSSQFPRLWQNLNPKLGKRWLPRVMAMDEPVSRLSIGDQSRPRKAATNPCISPWWPHNGRCTSSPKKELWWSIMFWVSIIVHLVPQSATLSVPILSATSCDGVCLETPAQSSGTAVSGPCLAHMWARKTLPCPTFRPFGGGFGLVGLPPKSPHVPLPGMQPSWPPKTGILGRYGHGEPHVPVTRFQVSPSRPTGAARGSPSLVAKRVALAHRKGRLSFAALANSDHIEDLISAHVRRNHKSAIADEARLWVEMKEEVHRGWQPIWAVHKLSGRWWAWFTSFPSMKLAHWSLSNTRPMTSLSTQSQGQPNLWTTGALCRRSHPAFLSGPSCATSLA